LDTPKTRPNHPPTVVVNGDDSQEPLLITVKHGETITIDASKSFDVDGDSLSFEWLQYKEADTFFPVSRSPSHRDWLFSDSDKNLCAQAVFEVKTLDFHATERSAQLKVTFPTDTTTSIGFITVNETSQNFHIILKVTDDGVPALTRYKRVIVTVSK
jgi:hypothetical protein